ncbi:hypothetical protein [Clostridium botulinum]|uniref:DNA polymerase III subunit beta n=1 Tax=Clostridium botulinum TaxID=1491 RepID=A0A0M1LCD2_CLOBO|nr:hypothetical protein [Clostridium botulinum]KOR55306.1 hypothetical protein ADT22_16990 [Clostridium botulinum]MCS6112459.1 hypothetical protein [Clostridium botulinum]NFF88441.1 hypothetical protein [Clostridium botulinum]NFL43292.1 hypothetical protein [Clostridium botulinum]NFN06174.1 hypothetical protein [Clostridium botulinum]
MKFIISRKDLLNRLNGISEAITNSSSEALLKDIVIVAGYNTLYLMGKYLDFKITLQTNCEVLEVGTILVESEIFKNIIEDIDDDYITVKSFDHNCINISSINSNLNIFTKNITTYL